MNKLPASQNNTWMPSLREQEARTDHRTWIGGRAITLLNHYWREDDPADLSGALGKDWADVLEGLPQDAIQKACIKYQRDEPRRKPTPGAIYQIAREMMPRPAVVPQPEPAQVERCSKEEASEIMRSIWFAPKTFGSNGDVE